MDYLSFENREFKIGLCYVKGRGYSYVDYNCIMHHTEETV